MSAEVYAVIEFRDVSGWRAWKIAEAPGPRWDLPIDQDYDLFAILANVRNECRYQGDRFDSISDRRGFPEDISAEARDEGCTGDHSATWMTLSEILAFDWTRAVNKYGYLNGIEFERWERNRRWAPIPDVYHWDVTGADERVVSEAEMRESLARARTSSPVEQDLSNIYCRISWQEGYAQCAAQLWTVVLPRMLRLGNQYGFDNVRLVMNFQS